MHGGADATGQSAIANDATAPTHRRRNPAEGLHRRPTLPEPAVPPVAVGHVSEARGREPAATAVSHPQQYHRGQRRWELDAAESRRRHGRRLPGRPLPGRPLRSLRGQ
jgi:hypothetical protein